MVQVRLFAQLCDPDGHAESLQYLCHEPQCADWLVTGAMAAPRSAQAV
jgi:hypothetical protein